MANIIMKRTNNKPFFPEGGINFWGFLLRRACTIKTAEIKRTNAPYTRGAIPGPIVNLAVRGNLVAPYSPIKATIRINKKRMLS